MNYILIGITVAVLILVIFGLKSYFFKETKEFFTEGPSTPQIPECPATPKITEPKEFKLQYMGLWTDKGGTDRAFTSPESEIFCSRTDLKNKVDTLVKTMEELDNKVGYFSLQNGEHYFEEPSDKRLGNNKRLYQKYGKLSTQPDTTSTDIKKRGKKDYNYSLGGITINVVGGNFQNAVYRVTRIIKDKCKGFVLPDKKTYKLKENADTIECKGEECTVPECADQVECNIMDCAATPPDFKLGMLKSNVKCSSKADSETPCSFERCCTENIPGTSVLSLAPIRPNDLSINAQVNPQPESPQLEEKKQVNTPDLKPIPPTEPSTEPTLMDSPPQPKIDTSNLVPKSDLSELKKLLKRYTD